MPKLQRIWPSVVEFVYNPACNFQRSLFFPARLKDHLFNLALPPPLATAWFYCLFLEHS